jgi:hypothetical protein
MNDMFNPINVILNYCKGQVPLFPPSLTSKERGFKEFVIMIKLPHYQIISLYALQAISGYLY